MTTQIQLRRGNAAQWTAANTLLADGEPALENDTGRLKFGDGVTHWTALPYFAPVAPVAPPTADPIFTLAYNPDGSLQSSTVGGVVTTLTWNTDGSLASETTAGVTRHFAYGPDGQMIGSF